MTNQDSTSWFTPPRWVIDIGKWLAILGSVLGAIVIIYGLSGPLAEYLEDNRTQREGLTLIIQQFPSILESQALRDLAIQDLQRSVSVLSRSIQIISAPTVIAEYSSNSRSLGPCRFGQPCEFEIVVRRTVGAESCNIQDGTTIRTVTSNSDNIPLQVSMSFGLEVARNIGPVWQVIRMNVDIPSSMPIGDAHFQIITFYDGCDWQINGTPPVSNASPRINFTVLE